MGGSRPGATPARVPRRRLLHALLASVPLLTAAACGGDSPTAPTPTLYLTCPANQDVVAPDGVSATVNYPPPTTSGGAAPVSVACLPAAGASFPTGVSNVQCTATDRSGQTATCTFRVTVTQPPRILETKFLAFGDSITWGEGGPAPATTAVNAPRVRVSQPYPEVLRRLLAERYTAQSITVTNSGVPGERATQGAVRLPDVLRSTQPEVLLLLEGANDLNAFGAAGVESAEAALRTMVRDAKSRLGAPNVFVATLTPMVQGRPKADGYAFVPLLNERIWELPGREGVNVVDIYAALLPLAATLISDDGLHPNQAGYDKMAEVFFATLRTKYEAPPATAPAGLPRVPLLLERPGQSAPVDRPDDLAAAPWTRRASPRRPDPDLDR